MADGVGGRTSWDGSWEEKGGEECEGEDGSGKHCCALVVVGCEVEVVDSEIEVIDVVRCEI